jgi:antibiotic biosynthesis monooxygenase (ABM) superfamily enzyme
MATKKQQRRRQKLKRHEYEEVYVDAEGNVLEPEEAEQLVVASPARKAEKTKAKTPTRETRRAVEPPSWRRTLRRGLIFFPLMLLVIFLLSPELSTVQKVLNTLVLMAFFIPFSYFMDTIMWRTMQRRLARSGEKKS